MTIQTAVLGPAPEHLWLVEVQWPGQTWRYLGGPGYIEHGGFSWVSHDDTWGQLMSVGGLAEEAGQIANREIVLTLTAAVRAAIWYGAARFFAVRIWAASRDPATAALHVEPDPWSGFVDQVEATDGHMGAVKLTLVSAAIRLREPDEKALYSPNYQDQLVSGDTGFDLVGGRTTPPFSNTTTPSTTIGGFAGNSWTVSGGQLSS